MLGQLTDASGLTPENFRRTFEELKKKNEVHLHHYIIVIEDLDTKKIVGTGTLLCERKFARRAGLVILLSLVVNEIVWSH